MTGVSRILLIAFMGVVVLPLMFVTLFERVMPTDIGVRQALWGGGVTESDFEGGFHVGVTGVHRWHLLPRGTQFLHFSGVAEGSGTGRDDRLTVWEPALELRTKDNNVTTIDVTVPYRIRRGEAHKLVMLGQKDSYRDRVKSTVESVLRSELSELSSEALQSTERRLARVAEVLPHLNRELAAFHVEADDLLVRRVAFPAEYEAKLQDKQYLTQKALLDGALALQANEERTTNSIEKQIEAEVKTRTAEWDKKLQQERSRYDVLVAEIRAEAQLYEARVKAAADAGAVAAEATGQLAIDQAEALRNELRNSILDSRGGRIHLALQAADNLAIPAITLNSNDPRVPIVLDLDAMTRLLLGAEDASP